MTLPSEAPTHPPPPPIKNVPSLKVSQLLEDDSEFYSQSISPNTFNKANSTAITSRQQATSCEILVASSQYLVALATRKAQFRTLFNKVTFTTAVKS